MPHRTTLSILITFATLAILAPGLAAPAHAGLHYRFSQEGDMLLLDDGEAWVEGAASRVDWRRAQEPFFFDVEIARGTAWIRLNTGLGTWFDEGTEEVVETVNRSLPGHHRRRPPAVGSSRVDNYFLPVVHFAPYVTRDVRIVPAPPRPGEPVAGFPTTRHAFRVSYALEQVQGQEYITSNVQATVELWVTDRFARRPLPVDPGRLVTGVEDVDEALAAALGEVPGFPLRRTATVTRRVSDTWPLTGNHTLTLELVEEVPVPDDRFEVPADYREWAPQTVQARPMPR